MNRFKRVGWAFAALLMLAPVAFSGNTPATPPALITEQAASAAEAQRDTTPIIRSYQRNQCPSDDDCRPERPPRMKSPPLVKQACPALVREVWSGPCPKAPSKDEVLATASEFLAAWGWGSDEQFYCLERILFKESTYNPYAVNKDSLAYGLPQALPGKKMASAGADWGWNIRTQLKWMMGYIRGNKNYGSPCAAWAWWQRKGSY